MTSKSHNTASSACCPVCLNLGSRPLSQIDNKQYWACSTCAARFVDAAHHPTKTAELAQYTLHENDPDDPAYRAFLSKLAVPLLERIAPRQTILDYGAGPGPALATMLREAGHQVTLYDPFFAPDPAALEDIYDVITCTETVEHFHDPARDFERFNTLLRPGGWLAIMTCFQTDDAAFANWHYRKDPTHVVFYRSETFRHIAATFGWTCDIPCKDVVLMQKSTS